MTPLKAAGLWLAMVFVALLPLPAETMAAAIGANMGRWTGPLWVWSAALTGSVISFWLARALGREALERRLPKGWMQSLDTFSHKARGPMPLLLMRLIPIIPFTAVNWGCGLTGVPFWRFFWTTGLGIVPGVFVLTWTGAGLFGLAEKNPSAAVSVTAALIAAALIFRAVRTHRFKHSEDAALEAQEPPTAD